MEDTASGVPTDWVSVLDGRRKIAVVFMLQGFIGHCCKSLWPSFFMEFSRGTKQNHITWWNYMVNSWTESLVMFSCSIIWRLASHHGAADVEVSPEGASDGVRLWGRNSIGALLLCCRADIVPPPSHRRKVRFQGTATSRGGHIGLWAWQGIRIHGT